MEITPIVILVEFLSGSDLGSYLVRVFVRVWVRIRLEVAKQFIRYSWFNSCLVS